MLLVGHLYKCLQALEQEEISALTLSWLRNQLSEGVPPDKLEGMLEGVLSKLEEQWFYETLKSLHHKLPQNPQRAWEEMKKEIRKLIS